MICFVLIEMQNHNSVSQSVPPWTGQEQHQGAESVDHKGRHLDLRAKSDDYTKHV